MKTVKSYHQAARVESDDDDDWTVNPSQTAFEVLYKQEREREREREKGSFLLILLFASRPLIFPFFFFFFYDFLSFPLEAY